MSNAASIRESRASPRNERPLASARTLVPSGAISSGLTSPSAIRAVTLSVNIRSSTGACARRKSDRRWSFTGTPPASHRNARTCPGPRSGVALGQPLQFARRPHALDPGMEPQRHQHGRIGCGPAGPTRARLDAGVERAEGRAPRQKPSGLAGLPHGSRRRRAGRSGASSARAPTRPGYWPRPSFGSRLARPGATRHRAARRGRRRAVRRQRRRLVGQRSGRDRQRALQGRGDPSAWAVAELRGRRVRHARTGRLVQQPPPSRIHRQHATSRGRGPRPRPDRRPRAGRVTQTKQPPENPGRFRRGRAG